MRSRSPGRHAYGGGGLIGRPGPGRGGLYTGRRSTGATGIQAATTRAGTTDRSASSLCVEARRSRPHAPLLSTKFRLHQSRTTTDLHYWRIYSVWRPRIFPTIAAGSDRLHSATTARLRCGIFRRIRPDLRPDYIHRFECDGLAGLTASEPGPPSISRLVARNIARIPRTCL